MAGTEPLEEDLTVTPEMVLTAYACGVFPMAEARDSQEILWVDPRFRGVLPLESFHVSRSLRRRMLAEPFAVTFDRDFAGVLAACADRDETWINDEIAALYLSLFEEGHAHSIELWDGDTLAGGVYGVALGTAFFGESMFSRRRDASKIALAYLVDRLRQSGFMLFDTQFITPHLERLGAIEIPRDVYHRRLADAICRYAEFDAHSPVDPASQVLQRITQTS